MDLGRRIPRRPTPAVTHGRNQPYRSLPALSAGPSAPGQGLPNSGGCCEALADFTRAAELNPNYRFTGD